MFLLLLRLHPRSTLFPYTTLFRSRSFVDDARLAKGRQCADDQEAENDSRTGRGGTESHYGVMYPDRRLEFTIRQGASQICDPDRKSTRLNSSHTVISYAVFCLKKK